MRLAFYFLLALLGGVLLPGCATSESSENASSRPWAQPSNWGQGLPSGINEGR